MSVLRRTIGGIENERTREDFGRVRRTWQYPISSYTKPLIAVEDVLEIIRSHMDEREVFKFDFNRVKSFDCQCGRHYVNTYDGGWIPVDERLPEEGEKILYDMQLVTLEDGEVCLGVYRNQENEWWTRRQQGEE